MPNKFIILSNHRSGTFLLMTSLKGHDNIKMFGEYYVVIKHYIDTGYPRVKHRSMKEICENIFLSENSNHTAVGLVQHRIKHDDVMFFDYLFNNKDIKIIFLDRENLLRRFISDEIAISTTTWQCRKSKGDEQIEPIDVKFNSDKFLRNVISYNERKEFYIEKFKQHNVHHITYERLLSNFDNELEQIQKFLNVDVINLKPDTKKQINKPINEIITNYSEMEACLKENNLEHYLDNTLETEIK